MPAETTNRPLGVDEAVDALLNGGEDTDEDGSTTDTDKDSKTDKDKNVDDPSAGDDGEEEEEDDNEGESDDEDEDDSDEDTDEDTDEDEDEELDPKTVVFTVEDDEGNEVSVTAEEAKLGYMRQKAFTQKTQALSDEKKELKKTLDETLEIKSQMAKQLQQLALLSHEKLQKFASIDWETLQKEDPAEFDEQMREYQSAVLMAQQADAHQQTLSKEVEAQVIEQYKELKKEETEKLVSFIPELSNEEELGKFKTELLAFGQEMGFSEEELKQVFDHRQILILNMAKQFKKSQDRKNKLQGKKNSKTIKRTVKQGQRRSASDRAKEDKQKRLSKVRKTGRDEDAVSFLLGEQ